MPDLAIIDATKVRPGEAIDSEINPIPAEIDIVGGSSDSYAVLSASSSVRSPHEDVFHAVTRRGREVRKPSRYRKPETEAITIANNYYSVFDIDDPMESPSDNESDSLFNLATPPNIEYKHEEYGLRRSAKEDSKFQADLDKEMNKISTLSPPPSVLPESALVGAIGTAFHNTAELQVIKLYQALRSEDKEALEEAIKSEHERFKQHNVFKVCKKASLPARHKLLSSTWSMKKKANGQFRARLTMRGYEQIPDLHYRPEWVSAPVTNAVTIRIMMVLSLMMGGYAHIVDVCSAVLLGLFDNNEELYASVPKG